MLESAAPTKSAKSAESAAGAGDESGRSTRKTAGLDTGAVAARGTVSADSAALAWNRGKIGSRDFSTNKGWTLDWPGQAGKFVRGDADETALV